MNRRKLQELHDRLTRVLDTGCGEGYHIYLSDLIDALTEDDPPHTVDRSLRGWVVVGAGDLEEVKWAVGAGLCNRKGSVFMDSWEDVECEGWTVRKLTPQDIGYKLRRWEDLTYPERDDWRNELSQLEAQGRYGDVYRRALEIAQGRPHE